MKPREVVVYVFGSPGNEIASKINDLLQNHPEMVVKQIARFDRIGVFVVFREERRWWSALANRFAKRAHRTGGES